jgi:putative endonuclease
MPYYVYILTNVTGSVLYTGVTNNLIRRIAEHRNGKAGSFTTRYRVNRLVYWEDAQEVAPAIEREKQIKGGSRRKKIDLIEQMNPQWRDLYDDILA